MAVRSQEHPLQAAADWPHNSHPTGAPRRTGGRRRRFYPCWRMTVGKTSRAETGEGNQEQRTGTLPGRSEEHTSELQSLMRISYAVFCLKKKIHTTHKHLHSL